MKIKDTGWKQYKRDVKKLAGATIKIGATGHQGEVSNATLLKWLEFGTKNSPARAPVRTVFRDTSRIKANIKGLMEVNSTEKGLNVEAVLNGLGVTLVTSIQAAIKKRLSPPNAPSTLKQKIGDLPGIDSGRMVNSIAFEVDA